ncbi:MAG: GIY-YIG nuclease family protein [Fusobacteriaceae bacterium]
MYLYVIQNEVGRVKIGITSELKKRFGALETGGGLEIVKKFYVEEKNKEALEKSLHKTFEEYRTLGEWFNIDIGSVLKKLIQLGYKINIFHEYKKETVQEMVVKFNEFTDIEKEEFLKSINRSKNSSNSYQDATLSEISDFILENCVIGKDLFISSRVLYEKFIETTGNKITETAFGTRMNRLGYQKKRKNITTDGNSKIMRMILGIELI